MLKFDEETVSFYQRHRGGTGNVVVVTILDDAGAFIDTGVFSSIEKAHEWTERFDDESRALICPYVVDLPEYGSTLSYQRN